MALIQFEQFKLSYEGASDFQLSIENLSIEAGEFVVLCGRSGSGKSSFARIVNALIPEYYPATWQGEARLFGKAMAERSLETATSEVACVFQNPSSQFFHRRVPDELVFPCENLGLSRDEIGERLRATVDRLALTPLFEKDLSTASSGEAQQVAMGTAWMQGSPVLLLDEPSANLDAKAIERLRSFLAQAKASGKTILIAEHRLHFLKDLATRYLYFDQGRLCQDWSAEAFLALPDEERKRLGLRASDLSQIQERCRALRAVEGGKLSPSLRIEPHCIGYGQTCLKSEPSFEVSLGRIVGIVGSNGSGKTTWLRQVAGLHQFLKKTSYRWAGQDLSTKQRQGMTTFVMQDTRFQLFAESVQSELNWVLKQKPKAQADVMALLKLFKLDAFLDRHPMTLSGGEQQRLVILLGLLGERPLLLLDEPTSGLDYEQMQAVIQALRLAKTETGLILVVSHDEEFLADLVDQLYPF